MSDVAHGSQIREWSPGGLVVALWCLSGTLLLLLSGGAFLFVYGEAHRTGQTFSLSSGGWSLLLGVVGVLVLHEALHGVAIRIFGGKPSFGAGLLMGAVPYVSCTSVGCRFTKGQFVGIALAPALLISAVGVPAIAYLPFAGVLVLPCAMNVGGSIGDLWLTVLALRQPRDTQVEDRETGVRFHGPPTNATWR